LSVDLLLVFLCELAVCLNSNALISVVWLLYNAPWSTQPGHYFANRCSEYQWKL